MNLNSVSIVNKRILNRQHINQHNQNKWISNYIKLSIIIK
jgi:hypothetical protein